MCRGSEIFAGKFSFPRRPRAATRTLLRHFPPSATSVLPQRKSRKAIRVLSVFVPIGSLNNSFALARSSAYLPMAVVRAARELFPTIDRSFRPHQTGFN